MAYFRSENNIFCDSIKVEAAAGEAASGIRPKKNFVAPVNPFRLDTVSLKFRESAEPDPEPEAKGKKTTKARSGSGEVSVYVLKGGEEILIRRQEVTEATSVVISGIGMWLKDRNDSVKVVNSTGADAVVLVDFVY